MSEILLRHSQPNSYDHAPLKTYCKVIKADESFDLYIQLSGDEENPIWHPLGSFAKDEVIPIFSE